MDAYATELQSQQETSWKIIKSCAVIFPFLALIVICLAAGIRPIRPSSSSLGIAGVAAILAATYFYTYRFFRQDFYFFIFLSWFYNALYLIPELNRPNQVGAHYQWGVLGLSFVASLILAPALFSPGTKSPRGSLSIAVGIVIGIAGLVTSIYLIEKYYLSSPLVWATLFSSLVSFYLIWAIAEDLRLRLGNEGRGWKQLILCNTLRVYALLQFFYPFVSYLKEHGQVENVSMLFSIAQLAKVGNAISMLGIVQSTIALRELTQNQLKARELELGVKEANLRIETEKVHSKTQLVELGMLASVIKHDVNTPLATMGFDIQSLKDKYQHDTQTKKKLQRLEDSMERVYAIVKVVDIFRGDQAFFDRDEYMSKSNMLELVHRAVRSVKNEKEALKQSNARDFIKVEGKDVWVRAYGPMFEQVIVNIIKNGIEAIDEAKRERGLINITVGTAKVTGSHYSRWARVEIEDNGIGIPAENLSKLTTLFTTRSDKKPNSGIGLFIGKKILDIHQGKMSFDSRVGEGTKVTLLLPEWNALQKTEGSASDESTENTISLLGDERSTLTVSKTMTSDSKPELDLGENV